MAKQTKDTEKDGRIELLPGTLDMLVLKTLAGGSRHGYGIVRRLQQVSADVLRVEEALNLPSGPYEIPLLIQDRSFNEDGSLFYPAESPIETAPVPSVLPSFAGDTILVNGKVWPYLEVG